jgi:SAM-dependent MidA family methyltransferase
MGPNSHGPIDQSQFLRRLGIETRAAVLKAKATPAKIAEIDLAVARLVGHGRTAMGALFKVIAFTDPKLGRPPGFE